MAEPPVRESYRLRSDAAVISRDDGAIVMRQGRYELVLDAPGLGPRALRLRPCRLGTPTLNVGRHQKGAFFTLAMMRGMKSCFRLSHS